MKIRKYLVAGCMSVLCVTLSQAQGKISTQWKCEANPANQHKIDVPDHQGHSYNIAQGKCTAEKGSIGGAKEQEGTFTEFGDLDGNALQNHGVFVETLASGDKIFYHYHGTQSWKDGKMETGNNHWTLAGGTGKFSAVKGEGGCSGKGNPDGSSNWHCQGSYSGAK